MAIQNSLDMNGQAPGADSVHVDRPAGLTKDSGEMAWGSDAIAQTLRDLKLPFIALNPGASYRGLHDSIVNYLGNEGPSMLVCLHEEHAVAIAHGYAKVTGSPMAVALHSNVGLMHGSMALFNAFCDRVPMVVLGAAGPFDAVKRRPWIDWLHTSADQAAMVRPFLKWDDQPSSVGAAVESLVRADLVTRTYPSAPTYVCLDATLQEEKLDAPVASPDLARVGLPESPGPDAEQIEKIKAILASSERTVILIGRVGLDEASWEARVKLAEALDAQVVSDLKHHASFPINDPRHVAQPGYRLTTSGLDVIRSATAIVALDWTDLGGSLKEVFGDEDPKAPLITCTMDHVLHNGWNKEYFGLAPVDIAVAADPDKFVEALLASAPESDSKGSGWDGHLPALPEPPAADDGSVITVHRLSAALSEAVDGPVMLARLPLGWNPDDLDFKHPLDYLGYDGAAGIGSGPGMSVGAALALADDERLVVAVLGDGDTLMGFSALWTAARHRLPMLVIVANNRSFYNDEMHQERVAIQRGRPPQNRWIGQHIRDPDPDIAALARSLGLHGIGPVEDPEDLGKSLAEGVEFVRAGGVALIDVRVDVANYNIGGVPAAERG